MFQRSAALIAFVCLLSSVSTAFADLTFVSHSVTPDFTTSTLDFLIEFSRPVDFFTVDSVGRQADSFQFWIDFDNTFEPKARPDILEAIIRGGEIHVGGDIRVRDVHPTGTGGPNSGGWGPLRGSVPFSLSGSILTFSMDFDLVGDPDGEFSYQLGALEFGGTTDTVFGFTGAIPEPPPPPDDHVVIPTPSSAFLGVIGFSAIGWLKRRRQSQASG